MLSKTLEPEPEPKNNLTPAQEMAKLVLRFLDKFQSKERFASYVIILNDICNGHAPCIINSAELLKLSRVRYLQRIRKGNRYDYDYVVSLLLYQTFKTYNQKGKYIPSDFSAYINCELDLFTINSNTRPLFSYTKVVCINHKSDKKQCFAGDCECYL